MKLVCLDLEVFENHFLCGIYKDGKHLTFSAFDSLSVKDLKDFISKNCDGFFVVGHNIASYDLPVLDEVFKCETPTLTTKKIKEISNSNIDGDSEYLNSSQWPSVIDTIKYFGQVSLKSLSVAADFQKVPNWTLGFEFLPSDKEGLLLEYNFLDLESVGNIVSSESFGQKIKTRAFFAKTLGKYVYHSSEAGTAVNYLLKRANKMRLKLDNSPFFLRDVITPISFKTACFNDIQSKFKELEISTGKETLDTKYSNVQHKGLTYVFGSGGLHAFNSQGEIVNETSDIEFSILDIDFASYYPNLILNHNVFDGELANTYKGILEERIDAKNSGDIEKSDALKLVLNSVFGQLGMVYKKDDGELKYSKIYTRKGLYTITIVGQLTMLKVCEELGEFGTILQVNTDGLTLKTNRFNDVLECTKDISEKVGIKLEVNELIRFFAKNVNDYVTQQKSNGATKTRGAFSSKEYTLGKIPIVCQKAAISKIISSGEDEVTIGKSLDIRDYLLKRKNKSELFRGDIQLGKAIRFVVVNEEGENVYSVNKNGTKVSVLANANVEIVTNLNNPIKGTLDVDWYVNQSEKLLVKESTQCTKYGTYFPNLLNPKKAIRKRLSTVLKEIKDGKHRKIIKNLRASTGNDASNLKKSLPSYIPHGEFEFRGKEGLKKWGDVIAADIDKNKEVCDDVELVKQRLFDAIPCAEAAFLSPSGGIKLLIRTNPMYSEECFKAAKMASFALIEKLNILPNSLALEKEYDLAKGFFLSYDPKILERNNKTTPLSFKVELKHQPTTKTISYFDKNTFMKQSKQALTMSKQGNTFKTRQAIAIRTGSYKVGGNITNDDVQTLKMVAIEISDNKEAAPGEWDSSYNHGLTKPIEVKQPPNEFDDRYSIEDFRRDKKHLEEAGSLKIGIEFIDEHMSLKEGNFVVVSALSSHGKTSFMVQMMKSFLEQGATCNYIPYEETRLQIAKKLIAHIGEDDFTKYETAGKLLMAYQLPIEELEDYCDNLKTRTKGILVIFFDYFQIIENTISKEGWQLVKEMATNLSKVAITKRVIIVTGSQVNADGETREGRDLYSSATFLFNIFNHSHSTLDKVGKRDVRYDKKVGNKSIISINLEKAKDHCSKRWVKKLNFDGVKFTEKVDEPELDIIAKKEEPHTNTQPFG